MTPPGASELLELTLRLVFAVVVGGLLGLNRELHGKPAGLRTVALVSLGSAVATMAVAGGIFPEPPPTRTPSVASCRES